MTVLLSVATFLLAAPALNAKTEDAMAQQAPALDREVLGLALQATARAWEKGQGKRNPHLTIIDYSLPSTRERMWLFDLSGDEPVLVRRELVAHGRNTGENRAKHFSNVSGSKQSSLGLFLTKQTYRGKHGYSLKLAGLEKGVNDHAEERAIVMHGAWYVNESFAREHGRLGRSWGCPALDEKVSSDVIDRIKNGSLLFVYYPDEDWLESSAYLQQLQ